MQDSINKIRRYDIDLLKFIACVMVVILHGIEPGGGIQQIIYLLGSFGIPLFFVVNGYLLSQKYMTLNLQMRSFVNILNLCCFGLLSVVFLFQ